MLSIVEAKDSKFSTSYHVVNTNSEKNSPKSFQIFDFEEEAEVASPQIQNYSRIKTGIYYYLINCTQRPFVVSMPRPTNSLGT